MFRAQFTFDNISYFFTSQRKEKKELQEQQQNAATAAAAWHQHDGATESTAR